MILFSILCLAACRARPVPSPVDTRHDADHRVPVGSSGPSAGRPLNVSASRAVTNNLKQVTYTFELPHPPLNGYVIQESYDGDTWFDLGRSSSTNFTRITVVDSTPDSGKLWRIHLPESRPAAQTR